MTWKINWTDDARKTLRKMDESAQKKILRYLKDRVSVAQNPSDFGKPLMHEKYGLWRYRVEDYRIICQIQKQELLILVVQIGHRKEVYDL
jgi:mRNA interferase RelE/StbE